jgi:hypothetical protein
MCVYISTSKIKVVGCRLWTITRKVFMIFLDEIIMILDSLNVHFQLRCHYVFLTATCATKPPSKTTQIKRKKGFC